MKTNRTKAGNIAPYCTQPIFELKITLNSVTDSTGNNEINIHELYINTCGCVDAKLVIDFADWINEHLPNEIITTYIENNWSEKHVILNIIKEKLKLINHDTGKTI